MNYKHVHVIYFSPTHTSAKIAHAIVEGMGAVSFLESDLTYEMPDSEEVVERELTVVAVPVYGGRVADTAIERLKKFVGKDSPVVPVVVYGNRDYEDALLELSDLLVQQGELAEAGEVVHSAFVEEGFPDFLDGISRPADFAGGVSYVHALQVAKDDLHFCGTDVEGGEVRPCLLLKGIILGSGGMPGVPEEHPSGGGVGCWRYGAQGQP